MKIVRILPILAVAIAALVAVDADRARAQENGDRFVVAVLPFASSDDGRAKDLQKDVIAALDDLGAYELVDRKDVNDAVEDAGLKPGATIPASEALEIGRALGAKIVARGTLQSEGDAWVADPVFVEVATRNTQELPEVRASDFDDLGERLVEAFNTRNQADKHIIFGRDYMRAENYERAIRNFRQALEFDPELAGAHYYIGQALLEQGQVDAALAELEEAIQKDPAYISAYHTIGTAYLEKGDTLQAKNFFDQLVKSEPNDCDVQVAYGYVMANELGEVDKGISAFEKAQQLCPDNPIAYQYYAFALPDDRREDKIAAIKTYLDLSEGEATDADLLEYLFGLYFASEQYAEAERTIDKALEADPTDTNLLFYAGYVRDKQENYRDAIGFYDRALEVNPNFDKAYVGKALAYKGMGNEQQYLAMLEKAGRDVSRIIASQTLRSAFDLMKAGRSAAALETARRSLRLGADACAANYVVGASLYDMGKAMQGENKSVGENQRSIELMRSAIGSLNNACGNYASYANGMIGNANQYIERGEKILQKLQRGGR